MGAATFLSFLISLAAISVLEITDLKRPRTPACDSTLLKKRASGDRNLKLSIPNLANT
jgi:hypothetical protein